MMIRYKLILCLVALGQVCGLLLLFLGVVGTPVSGPLPRPEDQDDIGPVVSSNSSAVLPNHVVLMVVDALRVDMMQRHHFPFMLGTLKNYKKTGILEYNVTVDSPTVTLPRIKTLVTGRAPTYVDILKNFQTTDNAYSSNQLLQDNLLSKLRKTRPDINICFFGDETWLRLFPPLDSQGQPTIFKKWEGVTSFFVKDFEEVDKNVTRNLEHIEDCHFTILHYLGLDHIGHVHGPSDRPDLIHAKLREMDKVVQKLYLKLTRNKKGSNNNKNIIIITGDHGMANAGGHGGSSLEEVTTPLIAIISGVSHMKNQKPIQPLIQQVDIAPTLSVLWDLRIPKESQGAIMLDVVEPFQPNLIAAFENNCKHLLRMMGDTQEAAKYRLWLTEISKMQQPLSVKKYIELENEMASALKSSKLQQNTVSLNYVLGVILLVFVEIIQGFLLQKLSCRWEGKKYAIVLSLVPPLFLYFSSSFIEEEHYVRYFMFCCMMVYFYITSTCIDHWCVWLSFKILCYHRLLTSFNQTGDKWSHLEDLNDFLIKENLTWLSALIGMCLVFRFLILTDRNSKYSLSTMALVYVSKIISTCESITKLTTTYMDELRLQQFVYVLIVFTFFAILWDNSLRTSIFITFLLLILHLQRLQNMIVTGLELYALSEMISLFHYQYSFKRGSSHLLTQVCFIWFAHSMFFHQGNSNGLATIDVSAGYIGFGTFASSLIIGILIYLNTYGNPLLLYLHFLTIRESFFLNSSEKNSKSNGVVEAKKSSKSCLISNPLPVVSLLSNGAEGIIYSLTLLMFRNHLFIWSVFVPKLMYLISQSVMHLLLCIINLML